MADEILTLAELAVLLNVAERGRSAPWRRTQSSRASRRGQWRFRPADLDAWIDAKIRGAAVEGEST